MSERMLDLAAIDSEIRMRRAILQDGPSLIRMHPDRWTELVTSKYARSFLMGADLAASLWGCPVETDPTLNPTGVEIVFTKDVAIREVP